MFAVDLTGRLPSAYRLRTACWAAYVTYVSYVVKSWTVHFS